jgi:hypothetical protein
MSHGVAPFRYPILIHEMVEGIDVYIDLYDLIRVFQAMGNGMTMDPFQAFRLPGRGQRPFHIATYDYQMLIHRQLNANHFDFSRHDLILKKWDISNEKWEMLTIDCHIMVGTFLAYLDKNKTGVFVDHKHDFDKITIFTEVIRKEHPSIPFRMVFDHIKVTTYLDTPGKMPELLLLTITDAIQFPNLRFTSPTVEVKAGEDFSCPICFDNADPHSVIIKTMCGTEKGHRFCKKCIHAWFTIQKTCPNCRAEVMDPVLLPVPM